jgi:hypothetical protein
MNLFRSEEHLARWLAGRAPGASTSIETVCDLAYAWYSDRLDSDWRPHTPEQNQANLESLGLTGDFWRLG